MYMYEEIKRRQNGRAIPNKPIIRYTNTPWNEPVRPLPHSGKKHHPKGWRFASPFTSTAEPAYYRPQGNKEGRGEVI